MTRSHLHFDEATYRIVDAALDRLVPGAAAAGGADYVDGFLGAFAVDPPRIWAVHPRGDEFHPLSRLQDIAWRRRIGELQARYADGLPALGADFADVPADEQDARLKGLDDGFRTLLFEHACEGTYGAPAYGGNRDGSAWAAIGFEGDVQPRGYTDAEVAEP